jgi:isoleucyl-tRNA synthetase
VHLEDWPEANTSEIDERLSRNVAAVREIVSLGLRARMDAKIKVRQPLRSATIVLNDERHIDPFGSGALDAIREELNVLTVTIGARQDSGTFGTTKYKPNFRSLGERGLGKVAQELKKALSSNNPSAVEGMLGAIDHGKAFWQGHEIRREDVEVTFEPRVGVAAATDRLGSVFLDTRLDDELRDLALLRELLNRLQTMRKDAGLEYTDRVRVWIEGSQRVQGLVDAHRDALAGELLAVEVSVRGAPDGTEVREIDMEGEHVRLAILRA